MYSELRDYVDICLFKLTEVNLSIALCWYLDFKTVFRRQICPNQETSEAAV